MAVIVGRLMVLGSIQRYHFKVVPMSMWVSSGFFGFFLPCKKHATWWTGCDKLLLGMNVCVCV